MTAQMRLGASDHAGFAAPTDYERDSSGLAQAVFCDGQLFRKAVGDGDSRWF